MPTQSVEEIDRKLEEIQEKTIDRVFAAEHDLWNALLAANSVTVAVLAVIIALKGQQLPAALSCLAGIGIAFSLLCVTALLGCFQTDRDHFLQQLADGKYPPSSDAKMFAVMSAGIKQALKSHSTRKVLEFVAFVLQAVNIVLIVTTLLM